MSERAPRVELLATCRFHVEIDGVSTAAFSACRGLDVSREVLTFTEGGSETPHVLTGDREVGTLRLERGLTKDSALLDWFRSGEARDVAVLLLDASGAERARLHVRRALPSSWTGPDLDASSSSVALEHVELSYEEVEWASR